MKRFDRLPINGNETMHGIVFNSGERLAVNGRDLYRDYFTRVFVENPSRAPSLPSLVFESDMGVVPPTDVPQLRVEWCLGFQADRPVRWGPW